MKTCVIFKKYILSCKPLSACLKKSTERKKSGVRENFWILLKTYKISRNFKKKVPQLMLACELFSSNEHTFHENKNFLVVLNCLSTFFHLLGKNYDNYFFFPAEASSTQWKFRKSKITMFDCRYGNWKIRSSISAEVRYHT